MPKASVIISVYNKDRFLALVVAGLMRQTEQDFEIILADDGSGEGFQRASAEILDASGFTWQRCWHADDGFRKNIVLNRAIVAATSPYLIFIDGDCIPHRRFVEEHLRLAQPGVVLAGRRINLPKNLSELLTPSKVLAGQAERFHWGYVPALFVKDTMPLKAIYTRNKLWLAWANRKPKTVVGSNFSLHKADMLAVNGFDERYLAPSVGEDTDVEHRLRLAGMRVKPALHLAVQYHLWHKLLPRPAENEHLFAQVVAEGVAYTPFGIVQRGR